MPTAANLFPAIPPAGPAKGAGKTTDATNAVNGSANDDQGISGPGVSSDTAKVDKAGGAKTDGDQDAGSSPFAEALAAALGMVLPPVVPQTPSVTPKDATTAAAAVSPDGKTAGVPATAAVKAPVAAAVAPADAPAADLLAASGTSAKTAPVTPQAIDAAVKNVDAASLKPAAPAATAPTADIKTALTEPAAQLAGSTPVTATAAQSASLADTPLPQAAAKPVEVAQAPVTTPAAPTASSPPAAAVGDILAADQPGLAPPVTAPTAAPVQMAAAAPKATPAAPADKVSGSSPAKAKVPATPADAAKAQAATPTTAKPGAVETLTDKAVAAVDDTDPASQAPLDKTADPSTLLASAQAAAPQAAAIDAPKVAAHTVAHLAAQIASNVDGKSTRFDVTLNPDGLGKVDVRVDIDSRGQMTAQLNFANADTAAQMQSKAAELHNALQQAGFDPSKTTLSFNSGSPQQGPWQDTQNQNQGQPSWTGRAFTNLSDQSDEALLAPSWTRRPAGGVDVRI